MLNIIQIVPDIYPSINGLGDYALCLARGLRETYSIDSSFIIGNPAWNGSSILEGFSVKKIARSKKALVSLLSDSSIPVVLHYVGYGYAKRGCPYWLLNGIREWKSKVPHAKLAVMFHELYASGPIWSSAFWLSPLQKGLAMRLMDLSDRCLTSKQRYADIIGRLSKGRHIGINALPVFSGIGEPSDILPLEKRKPRLVIFGGAPNRRRIYGSGFSKLLSICQQLGIMEILDIGPGIGLTMPRHPSLQIKETGILPAAEASAIMSETLAGLLDYNPYFLGKSSIFAAYCAHGMLPINLRSTTEMIDGIKEGEQYWMADSASVLNLEKAQTIADNAHRWYQGHSLAVHAKILAGIIYNIESA